MPKKTWTAKERADFAAKMKARREAKKAEIKITEDLTPPEPHSEEEIDLKSQVNDLQKQVAELLASNALNRASAASADPERPQANRQGSLIGSFEKYILDPAYYPDPRERLSQEPRLKRFAFGENYELDWEVSTTSYTTIDNVRIKEPRFSIKLVRVMLDDDTGLPTNKRYVVCWGMFHEDPDAALAVAREQGLEVDRTNEKQFLDEMRYLRLKAWLLEAFYPPKNDAAQVNKREVVIGNKLVEVYEVNVEEGERKPVIPFGELKKG